MNPTAVLLLPEVQELVQARAYAELREVLHGLQHADVADIVAELSAEEAAVAFRILRREDAGHVFAYFPVEKQEELIRKLGESGVQLVESMDPDDRVRLLDELPAEVATRIVASLSPEERKTTQAILGYPPGSVGRLMTPDYVRVRSEWTVGKALEHIRKYGRDAETVNVVYVVDQDGVLIDDIRLRQVIMADPETPIATLMNRQFVALTADQPQRDAVDALLKYDRVALPVVDSRGVLLGIVTHDDVADVAQEEATSDMHKMGGVVALDEPFMSTPVFSLFKKRAPWLALLFLSELLTSNAIAFFEDEIQRAAILAAFIPAIISSGGNSGSQASTLVIRALGLGEITTRDWARVLRRELVVALMLGLMIGAIGLFRIHVFGWFGWFPDPDVADHYSILGVTIAVTLLGVVVWGSIMGAIFPLILKKLKFDPAGSSTPFVATMVDVTGIVIYFTVAMVVLKTTLLRPDAPDMDVRTSLAVKVLAVEGYRQGDSEVHLKVQSDEQADGAFSRVVVPMKGMEGGLPREGDRLLLKFSTQTAAGAAKVDGAGEAGEGKGGEGVRPVKGQ
jgi:magnesium transporter